jgi:hypothetical protein
LLLANRIAFLPLSELAVQAPEFHEAIRPPPLAMPEETVGTAVEILDAVEAPVGLELPPEVAVLWIRTHGIDQFSLRGANKRVQLPTTHTHYMQRPEGLSLSTLARDHGGKAAKVVYGLMRRWSRTKPELSRWLSALLERFGADLQLVVADDTGFDIPWELFCLVDDSDGPTRIVGTLVAITRLQSLPSRRVLDESPAECRGGVLAYVDDNLSSAAEERQSLRGTEPVANLAALRTALRDGLSSPCALVYVAANASFHDSLDELAIGRAGDRLTWMDLDLEDRLLLLRGAACIVFLNACESAKPAMDPVVNDRYPSGFPELFLRRGAGGVIGTAGLVDSTVAAYIGRQVLEKARIGNGSSPAEILRELRAEAASEIRSPDDIQPRFLWPFMYQWFGHPLSRLHLTDGEAAP